MPHRPIQRHMSPVHSGRQGHHWVSQNPNQQLQQSGMRCSAPRVALLLGCGLIIYGVALLNTSKQLFEDSLRAASAISSFDLPLPVRDCPQVPEVTEAPHEIEPVIAIEVEESILQQQPTEVPVATLKPRTRTRPDKYMTFQRNGGRVNNQWFSLVAAIMQATQMNRTLLVPPEVRPVERTGMFEPELQWWDLDSLFEKYDVEFVMDATDPRLNVADEACKIEHQRLYDNFEENKVKYDHCPVIDMGGRNGLLQCLQHQFCGPDQRLAFDIYQQFRPGPAIRRILDQLPQYRVAVHSRTHGGGQLTQGGDTTICKSGLMRTARANLESYNLEEVYGQCYFNDTLLHVIPNEPFLLAHDGMLDFDTHYGDRAITVSKALKDPGVLGLPTGVLAAMVELFSMVKADYFYGMIYSTFALSVCMLRGEERKYDSNVCWALMHPESRYAEPPKSDYKTLACMVPFGPTHNAQYYYNIHATWGKRCDILRFFPDPTFEAHEEFGRKDDVVFLPMMRKYGDQTCTDGQLCRHIWEKMWRIWVWVGDNMLDKADYFLKVDTDTFLFPENTRDHVKDMLPEDDLYTGHRLYRRNPSFISGICTLFSRGTIRKLANVYRKMPTEKDKFESGRCVDRAGATEEGGTSVCLASLGINATAARDGGREKLLPFHPHAHLGLKKPENVQGDWFWDGKPEDTGVGTECCSDKPIALHGFKQVQEVMALEEMLYGDKTELPVQAKEGANNYNNHVMQRDYYQRVQKGIDRTKRIIVGDSRLVNVQVFFALCYYMPFDDLVCDPAKSQERQYNGSFTAENAPRPYESMKEAERWAYHRQPWIVSPTNVTGDLNELFPPVRPYRVVSVVEGDEVNLLRQRFGTDMMVMQKDDFADREKCPGSLRSVLYFWDVPYSRDAVLRACRETQAGQMTTNMITYLEEENRFMSVR